MAKTATATKVSAAREETRLIMMRFKEAFFDRIKLESKVDQARLRVLAKFGAFVRTRAQRSMRRRRGGVSAPGSPPFAHSGELREWVLFAYDAESESVVVGPIAFAGSSAGKVPALHEYGGTMTRLSQASPVRLLRSLTPRDRGKIYSQARRSSLRVSEYLRQHPIPQMSQLVLATVQYPARPYMRPALEAERPKFAGLFQDSIRE